MRKYRLSFLVLSVSFLLGLAQITAAQTAKYNNAGDLIWITDLLPDATGCEAAKTFTGKIVNIESLESENAVGYEFSLRLANGKRQKLQASLSLDEGALLVDFEDFMRKNRQIKVKARQCRSGGFWTAEEIK